MILEWAIARGRVSTTEAADITGLSVPYVGQLLAGLEDDGSLVPGRPSKLGRGFHYLLAGRDIGRPTDWFVHVFAMAQASNSIEGYNASVDDVMAASSASVTTDTSVSVTPGISPSGRPDSVATKNDVSSSALISRP